ncbi:MAG: ParB/RepB/Spo0J family partition protein [Actinomycetota bacterium]|nr:ParB/RepB/Spo0J family partition protein [Actinomycetota bacterium]
MTRRSGLGRGLDALLPAEGSAPAAPDTGGGNTARIDEIETNPKQPRKVFDSDALAELAASIEELGLLQPLLVRPGSGGGYQLIAGERRFRAAQLAGLTEVPVLVVETDDRGSLERALVENIHREDLNPIEEASALRQLLDEGGLTQEQLAQRLGRNRVTIANALRLLDLPTEIQRMLTDRSITGGHARALLGLQGSPFQKRLAQRVAQEGLSVRETEDLVRRYSSMVETSPRAARERSRPTEVVEAQRALTDRLQTKVRVDMGARKGKIVIDFVSLEELERLMQLMASDVTNERTISVD